MVEVGLGEESCDPGDAVGAGDRFRVVGGEGAEAAVVGGCGALGVDGEGQGQEEEEG